MISRSVTYVTRSVILLLVLISILMLDVYPSCLAVANKIKSSSPTTVCHTFMKNTPEEAIWLGLYDSNAEIQLSNFKIQRANISELYAHVLNNSPELFHVEGSLSYSYDEYGHIISIRPNYRSDKRSLPFERNTYNSIINEILSDMDNRWCDAQKALYIHDRMIIRFDYDINYKNYDVFSLFRDGVGVCQAYALAFIAVCRQAGLDAKFVSSDEMNHAWNIVCIDGKWYHIDLTRDDPIRSDTDVENTSFVRHECFLRSDSGMKSLGYVGYTTPFTCNDFSFETADGHGLLESAVITSPSFMNDLGCFVLSGKDPTLPCVMRLDFASEYHLTYLPAGDVDGNGILDMRDIVLMNRYITQKSENICPAAVSEKFAVSGEINIESNDLAQLRQMILCKIPNI